MSLLKKTVLLIISLTLLTVVFLSSSNTSYAGCFTNTDAEFYTPGSTVRVELTGANPNQNVVLRLIRTSGGIEVDRRTLTSDSTGEASFTHNAPNVTGDYVWTTENEIRDCTDTGGAFSGGFRVDTAESEGITFTTIPSTITVSNTRISITIRNLEPNKCFVVRKVAGFTGDTVQQHNSDYLCIDSPLTDDIFLKSDSDGSLSITDICENMEGPRNNCEDRFDAGTTYSFRVLQITGADRVGIPDEFDQVGEVMSFEVVSGIAFEKDDTTGDLPENVKTVVNSLVTFGIGIAGGVAFLLLVYGGFKFMFSMGNPENVQQGREIVTAAIIGLIVIVFSVFLLRLIGISILGLPL